MGLLLLHWREVVGCWMRAVEQGDEEGLGALLE